MAITKLIADSITSGAIANTPSFLALGSGSNQTISTNTVTKITDFTENFDTNNAFASGKFTVPSGEDGKYFFYASTRINTGSNIDSIELTIFKNGISGGTEIGKSQGAHWYYDSKTAVSIVNLSAADYVEMAVYHTRGTNANISGSSGHTYFGGYKIIT
jgi:hypothetical protein